MKEIMDTNSLGINYGQPSTRLTGDIFRKDVRIGYGLGDRTRERLAH